MCPPHATSQSVSLSQFLHVPVSYQLSLKDVQGITRRRRCRGTLDTRQPTLSDKTARQAAELCLGMHSPCRSVHHCKKPRIYKVALALGDYLKVRIEEVVAGLGFEARGLAPGGVGGCVWVDS